MTIQDRQPDWSDYEGVCLDNLREKRDGERESQQFLLDAKLAHEHKVRKGSKPNSFPAQAEPTKKD